MPYAAETPKHVEELESATVVPEQVDVVAELEVVALKGVIQHQDISKSSLGEIGVTHDRVYVVALGVGVGE